MNSLLRGNDEEIAIYDKDEKLQLRKKSHLRETKREEYHLKKIIIN